MSNFHERKVRRTEYYQRFVFGWKLRPCRRVTAVVITTTTVVRNARLAMAQAKSVTNQISRITAEIKRRWHR